MNGLSSDFINATPKEGTAVSTHGWDTNFTIPVKYVNQAIIAKKSSPKSFLQSDPSAKLSGNFGDWQIIQGGDGKNIRLSIPMTDIELTYVATGKIVKFKSGTVVIEIELEFLPHKSAEATSGGGKPMALVTKTKSDNPEAPVVSVVDLSLTPAPKGIVDKAVVRATFQDWGNANLGVFNHVFAIVNLNRLVDSAQWGFVNPNYTSYAYLDGKTLDDSLFSVLCMTGTRTGENNNQQVAYNAIPPGSVSGFLVSQSRTLYDLVRPAIMQAYKGLNDSNFKMSADQQTLYLTKGTTVDLKPTVHNGTTYYPKLTNLSIQSFGSLFTLTSHTTTAITSGITAQCEATHWYVLELGTSSKGQTLKFKEFQKPVITHTISQSKGSKITTIIIDIILAIVLLILTILTDGAALILAGLAIGLLLGANQIIPALIEKANGDDSPSIDLLQVNAVDPIKWNESKIFKLTYGKQNMSLQLGGDPNFNQ